MATSTTVTTSYAGEHKKEIISAALLSGNTLSGGGFTIKDNIVYREVIKKLSVGTSLIQNGACDVSTVGSVTYSERYVTPEEFGTALDFCKKDFRNDWAGLEAGASVNGKFPKSVLDKILAQVTAQIAAEVEANIWHGTNATAGEVDGIVTLATADSDVVDVVGTTVTAANVIAELTKVYNAIPKALFGKPDLKIFVPVNVMQAYVIALGGFGASGLGAAGIDAKGPQWYNGQALNFGGVALYMANGLNANYMLAGQTSNIWFGTSLMSDMVDANIVDLKGVDGSQNIRLTLNYTYGVNYGFGSELVLYTPD